MDFYLVFQFWLSSLIKLFNVMKKIPIYNNLSLFDSIIAIIVIFIILRIIRFGINYSDSRYDFKYDFTTSSRNNKYERGDI